MIRLFRKIRGSKIIWNSILVSIVTVLPGLVNFLFNMIVGTRLGHEQYGNYYTLLSLFTIIGLPAAALQFVASKEISLFIHNNDILSLKSYNFFLNRIIAVFTCLLLLILFLVLPFLKNYLHISQTIPFVLVFLLMPLNFFAIPLTGLLQSRERYGFYSLITFSTTFVKFGAGILMVYLLTSYYGAFIGILISQIIWLSLLIFDSVLFYKNKLPAASNNPVKTQIKPAVFARSLLFALISIGAFQLLSNIDTILVKHYLNEQSGIYSMINLLGKASLFLATAVSFVMLPIMSKDRENMVKSSMKAFGFLMLILISFAVFLIFAAPFISAVILKNQYPGLEKILPVYGFMFLPFAAISFFINYYAISENITYSLTILIGAAFLYTGIAFFHQNLFQVSLVVGITGYSILTALLLDILILDRKKKAVS